MHMVQGKKNATPPLGTSRGMDCRSRPAGRGSWREFEGNRLGEEGTPGRANHGSDRDLGAGQGRQRGGLTEKGRQ